MSEARIDSPTFSHLGAVAVWVGVQLVALGLAAMQVPLSDEFPRPVEGAAMGEMVIVQAGAAGMLFPMLFRNAGTTVALVASTWPFLQLAGMLSATPTGRVVSSALYLAMWMGSLGLLNSMIQSERARLRGAALATSLALVGPLLTYLHYEFGAGEVGGRATWLIGASPIGGALEVLNSDDRSAGVWVFMGAALGAALVGSIVAGRRRAMRVKLSTGHPQSLSTDAGSQPDY